MNHLLDGGWEALCRRQPALKLSPGIEPVHCFLMHGMGRLMMSESRVCQSWDEGC